MLWSLWRSAEHCGYSHIGCRHVNVCASSARRVSLLPALLSAVLALALLPAGTATEPHAGTIAPLRPLLLPLPPAPPPPPPPPPAPPAPPAATVEVAPSPSAALAQAAKLVRLPQEPKEALEPRPSEEAEDEGRGRAAAPPPQTPTPPKPPPRPDEEATGGSTAPRRRRLPQILHGVHCASEHETACRRRLCSFFLSAAQLGWSQRSSVQ